MSSPFARFMTDRIPEHLLAPLPVSTSKHQPRIPASRSSTCKGQGWWSTHIVQTPELLLGRVRLMHLLIFVNFFSIYYFLSSKVWDRSILQFPPDSNSCMHNHHQRQHQPSERSPTPYFTFQHPCTTLLQDCLAITCRDGRPVYRDCPRHDLGPIYRIRPIYRRPRGFRLCLGHGRVRDDCFGYVFSHGRVRGFCGSFVDGCCFVQFFANVLSWFS